MDCREILNCMGDLSADCLPCAKTCEEVKAHLEKCQSCEEEWRRYEQMMLMISAMPQPISTRVQGQAMWSVCLEKIIEDVEQNRGRSSSASPFWNFLASQPNWGWAALGSAVLVFGGVWMYAPKADTLGSETPEDVHSAEVIMFQNPPAGANSFINRHAAMSFDGFNDHVGSTLVSYSATAPVDVAPSQNASLSAP